MTMRACWISQRSALWMRSLLVKTTSEFLDLAGELDSCQDDVACAIHDPEAKGKAPGRFSCATKKASFLPSIVLGSNLLAVASCEQMVKMQLSVSPLPVFDKRASPKKWLLGIEGLSDHQTNSR